MLFLNVSEILLSSLELMVHNVGRWGQWFCSSPSCPMPVEQPLVMCSGTNMLSQWQSSIKFITVLHTPSQNLCR